MNRYLYTQKPSDPLPTPYLYIVNFHPILTPSLRADEKERKDPTWNSSNLKFHRSLMAEKSYPLPFLIPFLITHFYSYLNFSPIGSKFFLHFPST